MTPALPRPFATRRPATRALALALATTLGLAYPAAAQSHEPIQGVTPAAAVGGATVAETRAVAGTAGLPGQAGEALRWALADAELALVRDPADAAATLAGAEAEAEAALLGPFAQVDPADDGRLRAALRAAEEAVAVGDRVGLAAARGRAWTALLAGAAAMVTDRLAQGDLTGARAWLMLREFRPATRFSRPDADATLALDELAAGRRTAAEAAATITADLADTYQARLDAALQALEGADQAGMAARRAEAAALAAGYFRILAPAYAAQRGPAALAAAKRTFADLDAAGAAGTDGSWPARLAAVRAALTDFRAAPLSEEEAARRAGQFRRFLGLVPVEFARGVHDGRVSLDLEVREAITFRDGAEAAFRDVEPALKARDSAATAALAASLVRLRGQLADTDAGRRVAEPEAVRREAEAALAGFTALAPEAWRHADGKADFDVIRTTLDQMQAAVSAGAYDLAESSRLEAYAILESGPEAKLVAFAPQHKPILEGLFWYGDVAQPGLARLLRDRAPAATIQRTRARLDAALNEAAAALTGTSSPAAVATNAGIIVLREGLEAVLILAALLASLKSAATRRHRRPLWLGAGLALVVTAATWALAQSLLHTFARYGERLEAVMSIVAVGVLLVITNWFFHKAYWVDWLSGFHQKKGELLAAPQASWQWLGLVTLGFTSIYREGFETVLFAQALVLDAGLAVVLAGVAAGAAVVAVIGVLVFGLQARLPHRRMLIATAVLIGTVLVTMVGNTVHVLQVVGWFPIHPIRDLTLSHHFGLWLGVYPTWEGLSLQVAAATFALGSYFLAEHLKRRRVSEAVAQWQARAA